MERIYSLPGGVSLRLSAKAAVLRFSQPKKSLGTSASCGGLRRDLTAVYNHNDCGTAGVCEPMQGKNLEEHQQHTARELGLDPAHTAGLNTAVNLDNLVWSEERYEELSVTILISGGADANAACAGDPASLHERRGEFCPVPAGTINIILLINQNLSDGALTEALMIAAEAKASVLHDLMQGSCYSSRLATGTGTDGILAICEPDEPEVIPLRNAGKHFKLGELIGRAVRKTLPEALYRQTGFCAESQHSVLKRLARFGITGPGILEKCARSLPDEAAACQKGLARMEKDGFLVAAASMIAGLADQVQSGMLPMQEAGDWALRIFDNIHGHYSWPLSPHPVLHSPEEMLSALETLLCNLLCLHVTEQNRIYPH